MSNRFFITAIGTDSGKTLVSAIFCEALSADYWKPVQAGFPTDSETVSKLLTNGQSKILDERYLLKTPASPHAAAEIEGLQVTVNDFELPSSEGPLVVEGAGGILVPLNEEETMADLMVHLQLPVILVSNLYLGSINHTLLSFQCLKRLGVPLVGLVFNGIANPQSESVIEKMTGLPVLLRIEKEAEINKGVVKKYATYLRDTLEKELLLS